MYFQAASQKPNDKQIDTETTVQLKLLSATAETRDNSKIGVQSSDDKTMKTIPLQLPDQSTHTTHRSVTPILTASEVTSCLESDTLHGIEWDLCSKKEQSSELFSPMSTHFLVPPDYEAIFSGHQTLRVSETSQASLGVVTPLSQAVTVTSTKGESHDEDPDFPPDVSRVLSEFETTVSKLESESPKEPKDPNKGTESPQHSDSDMEFFDCRQAFSDFSEPEDVKLDNDIIYHISEPPSPMPGSSPDVDFLKGSPPSTGHPYLRVEDYKRFSSGSESLGDFAYDSEGSRGCHTEGQLPTCEELPSRDQAGYYDDDDFLGRVRGCA